MRNIIIENGVMFEVKNKGMDFFHVRTDIPPQEGDSVRIIETENPRLAMTVGD